VRSCAGCGQENPPAVRFCSGCGASLAAESRQPDERRIVTVLFVDLVGFTARAEYLDPEDVWALLAPYHERVRREIESFGGVVEKFIGDAVMGLFGAPVAHGDDAERAVRAALAIRDIAGELGDGGLDIRIAVNTGEAVVSLGAQPGRGEAMVAGDVVNTAARLQAAAPVNGVLVGEQTYFATKDRIRYRATEPLIVKGKELPVTSWLAEKATTAIGLRRIARFGIVGRDFELAIMHALWERTREARLPTLVSIIGPAGVGKSTLAAEFGRVAIQRGGRVVTGRSLPYRESGTYGALAGQLMRLGGVFESDAPDVAVAKLAASAAHLVDDDANAQAVAGNLGTIVGISADGTAADRDGLFYSVREYLEGAARDQPTILVFEDIHWADANLLDLVLALAGLLGRVPLLILSLARPELVDFRPEWGASVPEFLTLTLGPLADEPARELAVRRLGDSDQATAVLEIAEGNPLFIEQLSASIGETAPGRLPTSIREIVAARLDSLPAAERALLLDAAVVGKVFWLDALAELSERGDRVELTRIAEQLERRDLIGRESGSMIEGKTQFAFTHALIREVAYDLLPRAERARRHAIVAEFFGRATGGSGEAIGAMARHWHAAGDHERAIPQLLRVAELAELGWAKDHAAFLYREALGLVPEDDVEQRRSIRRRLALASAASLHVPEVRRRGNPQG
jgi:class 3 adenylate cyclase/energy-coupling factor transporter ATP-binding protein EcfA2